MTDEEDIKEFMTWTKSKGKVSPYEAWLEKGKRDREKIKQALSLLADNKSYDAYKFLLSLLEEMK